MIEFDEKYRDAVAREIRKIYSERKASVMGRPWKPNERHRAFENWQRAADQALRLGAPAEAYVHAAFRHCKLSTGPFPNTLAGKAAETWWGNYCRENPGYAKRKTEEDESPPVGETVAAEDIKKELSHLRNALYQITGEKDWAPIGPKGIDVVRSELLPMTPHSRLILSYPDETVKKYYKEEIMENFQKRPDVFRAMCSLGFDMKEITEWLKN